MDRRRALEAIAATLGIPALSAVTPRQLQALRRAWEDRGGALTVLDAHQNETVATVADMIIPETETPGARAARVSEFIDLLLADWYDDAERTRFLAGLKDLDMRSQDLFGTDFVSAGVPQRVALLRGLDAEVQALREAKAEPDRHFFARMKSLTLTGYYTSEIGMTQELRYQVIPGRYDGCASIPPWAPGGGVVRPGEDA